MLRNFFPIVLVVAVAVALPVSANAKKAKTRSDYSASQREKMIERARALCRKKYGANSRLFKYDYAHNRIICSEYHS